MKGDMARYKTFANDHMKGFMEWWKQLDENAKIRCAAELECTISERMMGC